MRLYDYLVEITQLLRNIERKLPAPANTKAPQHAPQAQANPLQAPAEIIREVEVVREVTVEVADPISSQLLRYRPVLQQVVNDHEIADLLLGTRPQEDEAAQLLCLLVRASQWERIENLWQLLAERCKQQQQPAAAADTELLQHCLNLYNLSLDGVQAQLETPQSGEAYDYQQQQQVTPRGDTITAVWLPGLRNAGGQLVYKPLVVTA